MLGIRNSQQVQNIISFNGSFLLSALFSHIRSLKRILFYPEPYGIEGKCRVIPVAV